MNAKDLHSALRELQHNLSLPRLWIVFAVVVGLFAVTGPFGTYDRLPPAARLGYWLIVQALAWLFALSAAVLSGSLLQRVVPGAFIRLLIAGAIAALPIGVMVTLVDRVILGDRIDIPGIVLGVAHALPVSVAVCALNWLALDQPEPSSSDTVSAPALLRRLPAPARGALIRIEVQDHYVLVVTDRGREMLLMRFSDAIAETDPAPGIRVHRSHWIALRDDIQTVRSSGRNARLMLRTADGAQIPVSRSYLTDVRSRVGS